MKMIILLLVLNFLVLAPILTSCKKSDLNIDVPSCVENKITEIKEKEVYNPPAEVWKWEVDHNTYYYFTSDCCDQYNYLYDENCDEICAPDGGFMGRGDGKCPEFNGETNATLIWKDERN